MDFISSFILAFGLSLDCFAISITQGLKNQSDKKKQIIILAFLFGLFQAGMFIIGHFINSAMLSLISKYSDYIASGLLFMIGAKMIKEGTEDENESEEIEITKIKDYIFLSVATSLDALAAGFSSGVLNISLSITSFIVGLISFIMTIFGGFFGNHFSKHFGHNSEIFGGVVLILLGLKVLFFE